MKRICMVIGVLMVLTPLVAYASPVLRTAESVVVNEDQEVEGDFYAGGGSVTISGTVTGDLYAAGGAVTVNGDVTEDAVIAGGTVQVHGPVGDDVRLVGGELIIADTVGGDVVIFGGALRILSTATIEGDVLFFGGEAEINGTVEGAVSGRAERVRINGPVAGNVTIATARALELGDQANIEGNVTYTSGQEVARAPGSVVMGEITQREAPSGGDNTTSIVPFLALFFTTLVYLLLFKTHLEGLMRHTITGYGMNALVGFGVLVLTPLAAMLLMVSIIGLPVGLVLMLGYVLTLLVAWSLSGILVGALLAWYFDGDIAVTLKWTLLGTLAVALVSYVPVVGPLVLLALGFMIIGGITLRLYARIRA